MCTMQKAVAGTTVTCQNPGANTHTGQHYVSAQVGNRTYTWKWSAPATSPTVLNTDNALTFHKPIVVGQADA